MSEFPELFNTSLRVYRYIGRKSCQVCYFCYYLRSEFNLTSRQAQRSPSSVRKGLQSKDRPTNSTNSLNTSDLLPLNTKFYLLVLLKLKRWLPPAAHSNCGCFCSGYPDHMVFSEFRRRFDVLAPHLTKKHGRHYLVTDEKRVSAD